MAVNPNKVRELLMNNDRMAEARHYNTLLDLTKVAKDIDAFYQGQRAGEPELVAIPTVVLTALHDTLAKLKA